MSDVTNPIIVKVRAQRERHVTRSVPYRVAFTLAGVLVTLAGLAMLITPGPAFVLIPAGLAMLAMEFTWAEQALVWALARAEAAKAKASQASGAQKAVTVIGCVAAAAAFCAYAALYDVPVLPV